MARSLQPLCWEHTRGRKGRGGWKQGHLFWETVAAVQEGHVGALDKGDNEGLGEKWPGSKYVPAGTREPADGLVIEGERTRGR